MSRISGAMAWDLGAAAQRIVHLTRRPRKPKPLAGSGRGTLSRGPPAMDDLARFLGGLLRLRRGQPAAGKAGLLQPAPQMRILPHDSPDERRALVFDHRADGPLVDGELVAVDPAEARNA